MPSNSPQSEERLRLMSDYARDFAIFILDSRGLITSWNLGAQRLLGYTEAEVLGKSGAMLFTAEEREARILESELEAAARDGRAADERWQSRKDGSRFWASGTVHASGADANGNPRDFVMVLRDETARKRVEEELKASRAAAEEANRIKDDFLATLSHELRTPLGSILLWSKMLSASRTPDPRELHEGLRAIRISAEAQKELIDDLLDVSRIASGQLRLQMRELNLNELVRDAVDSIRPTAEAKCVASRAQFGSRDHWVLGDPNRLRQVVWNLLSNAVKFTPAAGEVTVTIRRVRSQHEIEVRDTGRGIAADFLPHVFERFRQADASSTRTKGGMGLGLAIAHQLVELHGGTIAAQSDGINRGAVFTVRLPAIEMSDHPARHGSSAARARRRPSSLKGRKVLLVDDDPTTRAAVSTLLRRAKAQVTEAASAAAGLELFARDIPDLIVSDIAMPEEDGIAFIRAIRFREQAAGTTPTPAAALSAYAGEREQRAALEAGYERYLVKPIDPKKLLEELHELVQ